MQFLRETVTIQKNVPTRSARGAEVDVWSDVATVRADISPLAGREFFAAQAVNSEITYKAIIRYVDGIESGHRLQWRARTLEIVGPPINKNARNRELHLMCRVIND